MNSERVIKYYIMTHSEENYLKAIYHLTVQLEAEVPTNAIAEMMETKASSVTDMLKKLADKALINYIKYQGVSLTEKGTHAAKMIVRKHRLWEVFLVEKLAFTWDEVHDIAEQLEHIKSEQLINKLDDFLGNPTEDPHGDPIPDAQGKITKIEKLLLSELAESETAICVGVKDSSADFLQYLNKQKIALGAVIKVLGRENFDASLHLIINDTPLTVSSKIAGNLYVKRI